MATQPSAAPLCVVMVGDGRAWLGLLWASHGVRGRVSMQYREELVGSGPCRIRHVEMCLGVKGHPPPQTKTPAQHRTLGSSDPQ